MLRDPLIPEWVPPAVRYEILMKENWNITPYEVLKPYVDEVKESFKKSFEEEKNVRKTMKSLYYQPSIWERNMP